MLRSSMIVPAAALLALIFGTRLASQLGSENSTTKRIRFERDVRGTSFDHTTQRIKGRLVRRMHPARAETNLGLSPKRSPFESQPHGHQRTEDHTQGRAAPPLGTQELSRWHMLRGVSKVSLEVKLQIARKDVASKILHAYWRYTEPIVMRLAMNRKERSFMLRQRDQLNNRERNEFDRLESNCLEYAEECVREHVYEVPNVAHQAISSALRAHVQDSSPAAHRTILCDQHQIHDQDFCGMADSSIDRHLGPQGLRDRATDIFEAMEGTIGRHVHQVLLQSLWQGERARSFDHVAGSAEKVRRLYYVDAWVYVQRIDRDPAVGIRELAVKQRRLRR